MNQSSYKYVNNNKILVTEKYNKSYCILLNGYLRIATEDYIKRIFDEINKKYDELIKKINEGLDLNDNEILIVEKCKERNPNLSIKAAIRSYNRCVIRSFMGKIDYTTVTDNNLFLLKLRFNEVKRYSYDKFIFYYKDYFDVVPEDNLESYLEKNKISNFKLEKQ